MNHDDLHRQGSTREHVHELKCWPESFNAILLGLKTAEVRLNDRGFAAGDVLVLKEYFPAGDLGGNSPARYTGSELHVTIRHVHKLDGYIDAQGYVLLSLFPVGAGSFRKTKKKVSRK